MPEPQLSVRSARAKALAHRLAKKERRSIAQVVERGLELYALASKDPPKESAAEFWARIAREFANEPDIELDAIIREGRKPHKGINF